MLFNLYMRAPGPWGLSPIKSLGFDCCTGCLHQHWYLWFVNYKPGRELHGHHNQRLGPHYCYLTKISICLVAVGASHLRSFLLTPTSALSSWMRFPRWVQRVGTGSTPDSDKSTIYPLPGRSSWALSKAGEFKRCRCSDIGRDQSSKCPWIPVPTTGKSPLQLGSMTEQLLLANQILLANMHQWLH